MGEINNFHELNAWKENHKLVLEIYQITKSLPPEEKFGLISQIQRASVSITANIAEEFERYHFKDKIKVYHQARASLAEVQNFLILLMDLNYISRDTCRRLGEKSNDGRKLINGLIRATKNNK